MRWITYLESNKEAYAAFVSNIETKIEEHRRVLEDARIGLEGVRAHQGCITALRQILLELEDHQKESQSHGYGTDQTRDGPS